MNFRYTTLPGDTIGTKRPIIPVKFIHKNKATLPILSLVDSGADFSYLDFEIAEILGIDLSGVKPQKSFGINGASFVCYPSLVKIEIGGHLIEIPVHFSNQLSKEFPCILGQEGFFDKTRIVFERYKWNLDIRLVSY